jgi:hypothetical protein
MLFTRKNFIIATDRLQWHVPKGLQECLYINHYGISWPLSPTLSTSSAMKTPEDTKMDPDVS